MNLIGFLRLPSSFCLWSGEENSILQTLRDFASVQSSSPAPPHQRPVPSHCGLCCSRFPTAPRPPPHPRQERQSHGVPRRIGLRPPRPPSAPALVSSPSGAPLRPLPSGHGALAEPRASSPAGLTFSLPLRPLPVPGQGLPVLKTLPPASRPPLAVLPHRLTLLSRAIPH